MSIEDLIVELSTKPFNPELNFKVAVKYEEINQSASAASFYLRTVEYGHVSAPGMVYASLCKLAQCFEDQKDRVWMVSNSLLQAIAYLPYRPEGYFLMSRHYEKSEQWQESYTWAEMGLRHEPLAPLPVHVGYFDRYCLEFQKAVAGYWVGRKDESLDILKRLSQTDMHSDYQKAVTDNLRRLNVAV